jgi:hypothetical protein
VVKKKRDRATSLPVPLPYPLTAFFHRPCSDGGHLAAFCKVDDGALLHDREPPACGGRTGVRRDAVAGVGVEGAEAVGKFT